MVLSVFIIVICLVGAAALTWLQSTRTQKRFPPGPKQDPIIGNVRSMKTSHSWLYYAELKKVYGDIMYLSALGQPMIVLNSFQTVYDLVIQKASIYSDRPRLIMAGELIGWENGLSLVPYGPKWMVFRKLFHQFMNKNAIHDHHRPSIEKETRLFINQAVESPNNFVSEFRLAAAKIILNMTYGLQVDSPNDEFIKYAENFGNILGEAVQPGRFLVDSFPRLKHIPAWFPFAGFQKLAVQWREATLKGISVPFDRVKKDMVEGTARPSFTSQVLEEKEDDIDEESLKWLSGTMYGAAVDTMVSTVTTFVLAMVLNPEVQVKAQKEIDEVIGTHRLPGLDDKNRLPYVECILKEVLRWHTVAPLAVPYRAMEDFEYKGYFIPKDSILIANSWAISQDEKMYPSPEKFIPERFENVSEGEIMDPRQFAFGYGRRVCPGTHFAEAVVWMGIVTLLATTRISKAVDEQGHEITPKLSFGGGLVSPPDPFECQIEPRSSTAMALVRDISAS